MKVKLAGLCLAAALAWGACACPAVVAAEAEKSGKMEMKPERSAERVISDAAITGKVKTSLIGDKYVAARDINVDTVNGIVHLKGKVPTRGAADRAVRLAKKVDGVKGVKSHLMVGTKEKVAGYKDKTKSK